MTEKAKKWSDEAVATLLATVGSESPVSPDTVKAAAAKLGVSDRSVAAKLRQLDHEVASMAKEKIAAFDADETAALADFVKGANGTLTYKDIAAQFADGKFSAKQVQGKLLALELTGLVKAAEKIEVARTYTEDEEAKFISLATAGKFIEDIAEALNKTVASVRGKALSLTRNGDITQIPKQRESHAKESTDVVAVLGDKLASMTVAEIAAASDKTERGIRTLLTRRGISVKDYDGAKKQEKARAKAAAAA